MKAVTLQKEGIKVVDTSVPTPNDLQVLVKVYACGLNRSDLLETQGQSFGHMGSNLKILGGEFAGEVIELGSKVSNLSKGDKVMCRGGSGWAEFALAHHLRCVKFQNEQINWEKASSIQGSLQTMHDAIITNGKFKKGQSIFIQGASSGVGLIGLQIGKCLGASLIFGSSSDQTRLKKLEDGVADATFLACAGLIRLGMKDLVNPISPEVMMPAIAQGIIGIEQRLNDNEITDLLFPLNHEETKTQALAERAFLQVLDGSCRTPIGAISKIHGEKIVFSGQVLKPDGTEIISGSWEGLVGNPKDLGKMAGNEIKEKIDDSFFKQENFSH